MEVNSLAYWDARFDGDWSKNSGNRQTAGFAAMFIDNLPAFLVEAFKQGCSLCDWGCAEGEATRALSLAFPLLKAVGVDFSASAVANASARFPSNRFFCQDWTSSTEEGGKYDCVFASNVLEHFPNPFDVLWDVLALRAQKYLAIMVPFEEPVVGMCPEHMARFTRSSFPPKRNSRLSSASST